MMCFMNAIKNSKSIFSYFLFTGKFLNCFTKYTSKLTFWTKKTTVIISLIQIDENTLKEKTFEILIVPEAIHACIFIFLI